MTDKGRQHILDFGRIIALLAVMLFHFYTAHSADLQYGDAYSFMPYGYLGVRFFFILTGYFVLGSLERSASLKAFWKKKLMRLWIPLAACSAITFCAVKLLSLSADGPLPYQQLMTVRNLLFSCTFLEPGTVNALLGTDFQYINGGYWFMSAEFEFLLIVSLCFFMGKKNFFPLFGLVSLACVIADRFTHALVYTQYIQYLLWGMMCSRIGVRAWKEALWLLPASLLPFLIQRIWIPVPEHLIIAVMLVFWVVYARWGGIGINGSFAVTMGRLSEGVYAAYLLHEVTGVVLIYRFGPAFGDWVWMLPVILIILFFAAGLLIRRFIEVPADRCLRSFGKGQASSL